MMKKKNIYYGIKPVPLKVPQQKWRNIEQKIVAANDIS